MKRREHKRVLFFVAVAALILAFGLMFLLHNPASTRLLWYAGWIVWAVGIIFVFLPMSVLRSRGGVAKGQSYVQTTALVDSGIYGVVRHPQYLGWFLMYLAMMLFNSHWLIVLSGLFGMSCVYLFTRQEDEDLVAKFGEPYEKYKTTVPRLNIISGVIRLVRRTYKR
jgi:protein-S-isoprenylcysteine O-methyltransferase Ste14